MPDDPGARPRPSISEQRYLRTVSAGTDGPRAYPRDVELPGDPLPLKRYLAQLRRERIMRESGDGQAGDQAEGDE